MHVVSGTPGRVFDMIKRRALGTREIKMLLLDEADEMLHGDWEEDMAKIMGGGGKLHNAPFWSSAANTANRARGGQHPVPSLLGHVPQRPP